MGMFDTLRLDHSVACAQCSSPINEVQTTLFGRMLKTWSIGDVIDSSSLKTGILEEYLFCAHCGNSSQKIWISLWHSLLTGIYSNYSEAELRINTIDRAEILNYLMRQQSQYEALMRVHLELYHTIEGYADFLKSRKSGQEWDGELRYLATRLPEFLKKADPLAEILSEFKPGGLEEYVSEDGDY